MCATFMFFVCSHSKKRAAPRLLILCAGGRSVLGTDDDVADKLFKDDTVVVDE